MKSATPEMDLSLWQSEKLFGIDFASYTLAHHSFSRHFHDHYVIEMVKSGADNFYCNGRNYLAGKDQLVLINPGEIHTGSTLPGLPLSYYSFYPGNESLQQVADALQVKLRPGFAFTQTLVDDPLLYKKFCALFVSFEKRDDAFRHEELFFECMASLLDPSNKLTTPARSIDEKESRVSLAIDWLRSHFRENISLQGLAEVVRLNPFHFSRLFKKNTGLSPFEYLLVLRTEHARALLRHGAMVKDAATEAGFYDSAHFCRMFYKTAGTSPKSFRLSKSQYRTSIAG